MFSIFVWSSKLIIKIMILPIFWDSTWCVTQSHYLYLYLFNASNICSHFTGCCLEQKAFILCGPDHSALETLENNEKEKTRLLEKEVSQSFHSQIIINGNLQNVTPEPDVLRNFKQAFNLLPNCMWLYLKTRTSLTNQNTYSWNQ